MLRPNVKGISLIIVAVVCFAAFDSLTKWVGTTVPLEMVIWFRYLFQTTLTAGVLLPIRGRAVFMTRRPYLQVIRGMLLVLVSVFAFLSLKYLPVAEFTAIAMITPLVITLLATILIGEEVSVQRWMLLLGGFIGALMVVRPGGQQFGWPMLLPLGFVIANATFQLVTSQLAKVDHAGTTHLYTGAVGALVMSLAVPFGWQTNIPWQWWLVLVVMGSCSSLGHFLLIKAYSHAPVAVLTPYLYGQIGFAMLGGWLLFSHVPDLWALVGISIVACSGVLGTCTSARMKLSAAVGDPAG